MRARPPLFTKGFLLFFLFLFSSDVFSGFFSTIWGAPTSSRLLFEPYGLHIFCGDSIHLCTNSSDYEQPNNAQFLTQLTWKGYAIGTFTNSYSHQTGYIAVDREVISSKHFGLSYLLGVIAGYHNDDGSFGHVFHGYPFPLVALDGRLNITKRFTLDMGFYGIGVLFGASYFF